MYVSPWGNQVEGLGDGPTYGSPTRRAHSDGPYYGSPGGPTYGAVTRRRPGSSAGVTYGPGGRLTYGPAGSGFSGLGISWGGGTGYAPGAAPPATMDPIVITERQGGGSGWEGGGGGGYSSGSSGGGVDPNAVATYVNTGARVLTDLFAAFRGGAGRGATAPPPTTSSMSALMPVLAIIGVGIGAVVIVKALKKRSA